MCDLGALVCDFFMFVCSCRVRGTLCVVKIFSLFVVTGFGLQFCLAGDLWCLVVAVLPCWWLAGGCGFCLVGGCVRARVCVRVINS